MLLVIRAVAGERWGLPFAVSGNHKANLGTLPRLTCQLNVPAVSEHEVPRDRQSESQAARFSSLVEPLEHAIGLLRFHACAAITHFDGNSFISGIGHANHDCSAGRSMFDSVR